MKSNKAAGLDGLTVEFDREFWGKVKFFLIDVLNKSYDEKQYIQFGHYLQFFLKLFLNAVLEHKKEVLNQHLKEKLVYNYLELRDIL
jgi:hypothetical protein